MVHSFWHKWKTRTVDSVKNAKYGLLRRSKSFKVIDVVDTNRKRVYDFLLVINSN